MHGIFKDSFRSTLGINHKGLKDLKADNKKCVFLDEQKNLNTMNTAQQQLDKGFFGHPKGLLYLFFAELWERFSFYGMRALLTLYMVNEIFEALATRDIAAAAVYASYGSLVYASTVIGGKISDSYLGFRQSILLGGILMALGHFVLAIENNMAFFLALAFIIVGNGFFKPNISTFVGSLYPDGDRRKDSGFVIFYMGINIGGFVAPFFVVGWDVSTAGIMALVLRELECLLAWPSFGRELRRKFLGITACLQNLNFWEKKLWGYLGVYSLKF